MGFEHKVIVLKAQYSLMNIWFSIKLDNNLPT